MALIYNLLAAFINVAVMVAFKLLVLDGNLTANSSGLIRNLFGFIAFSPLIIFHLFKNPKDFTKNVPHKWNFLLGITGGIAMFIWPIVYINIETHIAMTFAFMLPFLANFMLMLWCKEKIPKIAWIAKILCLIAVFIILKPKFPHWNIYYSLALVCVVLWSVSVVFNKKISQSGAKVYISLYWYLFLTTIFTVMCSISVFKEVSWLHWKIFLLIGGLNSLGNFFTLLSFKKGNGYLPQMMEFVKFIVIIACDILLFDGTISITTTVGSLIICLAIGILFFQGGKYSDKKTV
jgi:drug/metabolite transporter (DMT)-like permease